YGDAWATLGFIRARQRRPGDAEAACERAVGLDPDNWRHLIRLAEVSWGETRLSAARRALALSPGLPLASWHIATVYVARGALDAACRQIDEALRVMPDAEAGSARFAAVGLWWMKGLLLLRR